MFDAERFCIDYNIEFATSGPHYRRGWVNISCPFCTGNPGHHGGFNIEYGYYSCYRCSSHWLPRVIKELTNLSFTESRKLIAKYSSGELQKEYQIERPETLILPHEFKPLSDIHYQYLKSRNFNPNIARQWNLLASGIHGEYSHRIIAPIYLDGELVSYQGRDYTGKSELRYKTCSKNNEVHDHKHTTSM
jgi:hypothetical protein